MAEGAARAVPARTIDVRLTLPQLWVALAILLPVLGALLAGISTVDLAYHLRAGAIVLDSGRLPSPDTFTFTAGGLAWLDQQWGAQVVFAALDRAGGWALLAVVRAGLVGLTSLLVYRACRSAGAEMRPAAWLTLGGFAVGLVALGLRPQLLAMVLFAATLAILAGRTRRPALVWAIPILVVLWANVHGSFFLGPAAVVVAWLEDRVAGRRERRLVLVAAASALATLVNPYGPGVWTYAAGLAVDPTIRRLITEWQATAPLSFAGAMFYGSLLGVVAILTLALRRASDPGPATRAFLRRSWPTLLWLLGLAAIGAYAERGVAWWSIALPIALGGLLVLAADARAARPETDPAAAAQGAEEGRPVPRTAPPPSLAATSIVVVLVVAVVALLPVWRGGDPLYGPTGLLTDAPRGMTDTLLATARPGDRIWNAQRWGSWLEYAVPATPVAVDSRIELIPADAWADHLALSSGAADWSAILDRRGVTIVVASATEQRSLIERMRASTAWRPIHDDADGVVFVRAERP
jgi:hypothetical protein